MKKKTKNKRSERDEALYRESLIERIGSLAAILAARRLGGATPSPGGRGANVRPQGARGGHCGGNLGDGEI
jgi:hypothetical protein